MERSLKMVDGHYQVALPWRADPPYLPNNRSMVERRAVLLRKQGPGLIFQVQHDHE